MAHGESSHLGDGFLVFPFCFFGLLPFTNWVDHPSSGGYGGFLAGKNRSTRSTNREFLGNGKCFCFVIRDVPICPIGFLFLKLAPPPRALLLVVFF